MFSCFTGMLHAEFGAQRSQEIYGKETLERFKLLGHHYPFSVHKTAISHKNKV